MRGRAILAAVAAAAVCGLTAQAGAHTYAGQQQQGAGLTDPGDAFSSFALVAAFPLPDFTSSDIAFWGDRAYVGNYGGFRIFDVSGDAPTLLADVHCEGAQGDPSVWDRDKDGTADLLILSVDRTMESPECGAVPTAHDNPDGWEGLRIFDVEDPANVTQIATVYQDCGSHTNTLIPRLKEDRLLVLNSSYPLRAGPTCGPVRGPEAGRSALHGVVQVVEVPLDDPTAAHELTELPISYPGDDDGKYLPISEHSLNGGDPGTDLVDGMIACHDIAVFVETGLVGAACGEQAQVWRLDEKTGLPDTANPLWVYDQDNVDFWHSATFTWDGAVVNFIDESFGDGCPTTTVKSVHAGNPQQEYESGNMFFMDSVSGELLSEFRIPRGSQDPGYCSSHLGNVVPAKGRYLLANAYYRAGSSVIDFTDPRNPQEIAYGDRTGAGTWSAYWYEDKPEKKQALTVFSNDGVDNDAADKDGFEQWAVALGDVKRHGMKYLNPQTQEKTMNTHVAYAKGKKKSRFNSGKHAKGKDKTRIADRNRDVVDHLATG